MESVNSATVEIEVRYTAFYIIKPAESLKKKVEYNSLHSDEFPFAPLLWTNRQGGRSSWTSEDYVLAMKCLFVAYLKYCTLPALEIRFLFGDLEISAEGFDAWWEMELYDGYDDNVDDLVQEISERRSDIEDKDAERIFNPESPLGRLLSGSSGIRVEKK